MTTVAELNALDLGYLKGYDLSQYCNAQVLINQYSIDSTCLQRASTIAQGIIQGNFASKYDMATEFAKSVVTDRDPIVLMCMSITAIEIALSNLPAQSEHIKNIIDKGHQTILDVRNGQMSLVKVNVLTETSNPTPSGMEIVDSSFNTLG